MDTDIHIETHSTDLHVIILSSTHAYVDRQTHAHTLTYWPTHSQAHTLEPVTMATRRCQPVLCVMEQSGELASL